MEYSEEFEREDIRKLVATLIELYYVILSLNPIIYEHTRVTLKGHETTLPLELARTTLLLGKIASILKEAWKAVYSPARALIEELKISNTIEGRIDIPLTSRLMGQGLLLVASRKTRLTLESIENIFLKAFMKRLERDSKEILTNIDNFSCNDPVYEEVFKAFTENVREKLSIILRSIREINEKTFLKHLRIKQSIIEDRILKRLARKVLERKIRPYSTLALWALEYIKTNMLALLTKYGREAREISNLKLGLWDYKLYEIYTYYVVTYVTAKTLNIRQIIMRKDEVHLSSRRYEVKITYDKVPECKSWIAHGKHIVYNGNEIVVPAGRPDVAIHLENKVVSVCDAKYRVSMRELSESRFKVLGYMHEYNSVTGTLVFDPTHTTHSSAVDSEAEENIEFLEKAMKHGGVIVEDKNKTLYVVALEPKSPSELVESREYRIIENMVERSVMGG